MPYRLIRFFFISSVTLFSLSTSEPEDTLSKTEYLFICLLHVKKLTIIPDFRPIKIITEHLNNCLYVRPVTDFPFRVVFNCIEFHRDNILRQSNTEINISHTLESLALLYNPLLFFCVEKVHKPHFFYKMPELF